MTQRLVQARKARGLSQTEAAEQLGVSRQAISRWETGVGLPTLDNLIQMSRLYQVSLDELVHGAGPAESDADETLQPMVETPGPLEKMQGPRPVRRGVLAAGLALAAVVILLLGIGYHALFAVSGEAQGEKISWGDLEVEEDTSFEKEFDLQSWE